METARERDTRFCRTSRSYEQFRGRVLPRVRYSWCASVGFTAVQWRARHGPDGLSELRTDTRRHDSQIASLACSFLFHECTLLEKEEEEKKTEIKESCLRFFTMNSQSPVPR